MDMSEIKTLIDKQGEAFSAFKTTLETELKGKLAKDDPIITDKLSKIESTLDDAVEAKSKIEAALQAEKKEREELEARINREGIKAGSEAEAKKLLAVKDFNVVLQANASDRKRSSFTPLDEKGYDEYKAAHERFIREGKESLSPEEVKTLSVGSDPDGGYFVTPDTTGRIVNKVYESSPMRQYASQQTISTDALEGIEDLDEAGAGYAGEHATSGNTDTPEVGKWKIPVFWIDTEPKATQQLLDDAAVDIDAWLSGKVSSKFARFENAEFVTGSANKIRGITGYDTAADDGSGVNWGTIGHVISGADGGFVADASKPVDKLIDLMGALKQEYLSNAVWFTRRSVITAMRKFKDTTNQLLWQPSLIVGQPETFMGYPIARMEDMPALTTGSLSLGFGDLRQAYQIVDRQGIRVLRDNLTSKPYVKFYTTKRTGGGMVNFEAIKLMKFSQ
jgi:HK97 family phage major capsid protein